jgi:diadenosine tetraphosphate (Ap4A) HIT family hydrolase
MQSDINFVRGIFQNKIKIHPKWNQDNFKKLQELFDLEDEEIQELYLFTQDIANHCLEEIGNRKDRIN